MRFRLLQTDTSHVEGVRPAHIRPSVEEDVTETVEKAGAQAWESPVPFGSF